MKLAKYLRLEQYPTVIFIENIVTWPKTVTIRDTPLGRMAIQICSDFPNDDDCRKMLYEANVNLIIVPAMTGVPGEDFTMIAERFARYTQATTVFSNNCALPCETSKRKKRKEESDIKVSFAFLPGRPEIWWCTCHNYESTPDCRQCAGSFILRVGQWPHGFVEH